MTEPPSLPEPSGPTESCGDSRRPNGRLRLDFLHGIRGLLSLWVMLFHLVLYALSMSPDRETSTLSLTLSPFLHGYLAVPAFLILSGFLLMMPVVLGDGRLPGGLRGFLARRFMRIVPPYYAAYL